MSVRIFFANKTTQLLNLTDSDNTYLGQIIGGQTYMAKLNYSNDYNRNYYLNLQDGRQFYFTLNVNGEILQPEGFPIVKLFVNNQGNPHSNDQPMNQLTIYPIPPLLLAPPTSLQSVSKALIYSNNY